jgi:DNA-directed RNA polymerase sigma subunit (sigma70/sigma32)
MIRVHGIGKLTKPSKDIARMIMFEPERSYADIGKHFGVTRQRVGAIAQRLDIARYKKGVRDDAES